MTDSEETARHVRRTYDRIAGHFAETRAYPWPEVEAFLADAPEGRLGVDVGCGNGRHAEPMADRVDRVVGVDVSAELLGRASERARERGYPFDPICADAAALPLADDCADLVVYVAALHHLPDRESRVRSLDELARVLAPGGRALVSAWSTEHDRFDRESGFDTTVDWTLPGGETVPRFYHVYDPDEFRADVADSALELVDFEISSGNCYGEVRVG
ncbi:SAM-dependent methyltransferase [Halobacteriales archaeon QS_1_68_20]|nr:MAG: SAM-dependent methyltransferase [Halobacteriales archaeon QS_1_68_20]